MTASPVDPRPTGSTPAPSGPAAPVATGPAAVTAALVAAWSGADPGPRVPADRPDPALPAGPAPHPLPRFPDPGVGGLLDLAVAGDPARHVGGVRLRRVPSAGGRYPVDVHVVGPDGPLAYDPLGHALARPLPPGDGVTVLLTLDPVRTAWRYGPRSLPLLLLDLGHAVAALRAAAAGTGRPAAVELGTCRAGLPAAAVRVGARSPAPVLPAARGGAPAWVPRGIAVPPDWTPPGAPAVVPAVLVARRSAAWEALTAPGTEPALAAPSGGEGVDTHLIAHRPLRAALAARSAGRHDLADVAALLVVTAHPDPHPPTLLARHLDAAAAVHTAWLAATAAGVPARPVGGWVDAVLTGPSARRRVVHALALGPAPRDPVRHRR